MHAYSGVTGTGPNANGGAGMSVGRKTFYISDYQKAKQQREWHQ